MADGLLPAYARLIALDRIVTALIVALVVTTPFALGSVYPWPAALIEVAAATLVIVWAIKIVASAVARENLARAGFFRFVPPLALLAALLVIQLIPLPPGLLRVLSPHTYEVYARTLPGWPRTAPYSEQESIEPVAFSTVRPASALMPTLRNVRHGAPIPFVAKAGPSAAGETDTVVSGSRASRGPEAWTLHTVFPTSWRPLAISPALTTTAILRFCAYAGLFLVVVNYRFADGRKGETRFYVTTVVAALAAGVMAAAIGLLERVYWNGKILWCCVPMDWGASFMGSFPRATGPFVNPDHFANYLSMVFPLALAGSFYELYHGSRGSAGAVRMLCAASSLIILSAIVLSLSRAAWIGAAASAVGLSLLWASDEWRNRKRASRESSPGGRRFSTSATGASQRMRTFAEGSSIAQIAGVGLAALAAMAFAALVMIGPRGRRQSDVRLGQTIADGGGLGLRPSVWKDSLDMVRDFPLFGVGLGGWPEIFPHYQTGPWNEYYFREAHNDYLQYLTETGLVGLVAMVWFLGLAVGAIARARHGLSSGMRPLLVALILAVTSMALHEGVDFCMHIPANAVLCTLLLALAIRLSLTVQGLEPTSTVARPTLVRIAAGSAIAAGVIFISFAFTHRGLPYPYDIERATSPSDARTVVIQHPASAAAHMMLLDLTGATTPAAFQLRELATAVWLDPTDPSIRDRYAERLDRLGKRNEALGEVTKSVFDSPAPGEHYYLDKRLIPWLLPDEQRAIENGFIEAVAAGYPGAVSGLGGFYDSLGDFSDEVKLFSQEAGRTSDASGRTGYLIDAANASMRAGNQREASAFFRQGIATAPSRTDVYVDFILYVCARNGNMREAQSVARDGIRNGADPLRLYMTLARVAQKGGDSALAEDALVKAVQYSPSFGTIMRAAEVDLQLNQTERAASMLRNAVELNPRSAEAYFLLGGAEERDYRYWNADRAYARAAELAPKRFLPAYTAFRRRMEAPRSGG